VAKFIVPVLYRRFISSKLFIPVFCLGRGGTESGRARGRLITIFKIVVPILGRISFGRTGMEGRLLFLDRTGGGPCLINEVIVPVFGHVAWFENTLGSRHSRIGTVMEIKSLVPVLGVASCRNFSEGACG
jgi:hypothetical protein